MPTYEYRCKSCEHELEEYQHITEDPLEVCPACEEPQLQRLIGSGNFILKGRGWYSDLYTKPPKEEKDKKSSDKSNDKSD